MMRSRKTRREASLETHLPDPILSPAEAINPEMVTSNASSPSSTPSLMSLVRGARAVAERAMTFRHLGETSTPILVNGIPGAVAWAPDGSPFAVVAMTVKGGRIVVIDALADPDRLGRLDLTVVAR
jgi:hypothetical protein